MTYIRSFVFVVLLNVCSFVMAQEQIVNLEDTLAELNHRGQLNHNQQMVLSEILVHKSCNLFRERKIARAYLAYIEAMEVYPLGFMQLPPAAQMMSFIYYWWISVPMLVLLWTFIIVSLLRRDSKRAMITGVMNLSHYHVPWQKHVIDILMRRQRFHDIKMLWPFYLFLCLCVTLSLLSVFCSVALSGVWALSCALLSVVLLVLGILPQRNVKEFLINDFRQHVLIDLAREALETTTYCPVKSNDMSYLFKNEWIKTFSRGCARASFEFNVALDDIRSARIWEVTYQKEISMSGKRLIGVGEPIFSGIVMSIPLDSPHEGNTLFSTGAFPLAPEAIPQKIPCSIATSSSIDPQIYSTNPSEASTLVENGILEKLVKLGEDLNLLGYKCAMPNPAYLVIANGRSLRIFISGRTKLLSLNRRDPVHVYNVLEQVEVLRTLICFVRSF